MAKFEISVTQVLEITIDENKMNEEFMEEFRKNFYPFMYLEDHAKHIAQLYARGIYSGWTNEEVEGYGSLREDFGVRVSDVDQWENVDKIDGMQL